MIKTKFVILAGGFGTRLKEVVKDVPKTLAPVNNKPFLYYSLKKWTNEGFSDFLFLLYYQADQIIEFLDSIKKENWAKSISIEVIVEDKPLGTAGSVANAIRKEKILEPFVLTNSDTWISSNLKDIVFANTNTIAVIRVEDCARYGTVEIKENKIIQFNEKSEFSNKYINSGVYYLEPSVFKHWDGNRLSIETDIFPNMSKNNLLEPFYLKGEFIDIGVPKDYIKFCNKVIMDKIIP
jgi:NDP-sugar pyrophosphorylase family protein